MGARFKLSNPLNSLPLWMLTMFLAACSGSSEPSRSATPGPWPEPAESDRHYVISWQDETHGTANESLHEVTDGRHHHLHRMAVSRLRVPDTDHESWLKPIHEVIEEFEGVLIEDVMLPVEERILASSSGDASPPDVSEPLVGLPNDPFTNVPDETNDWLATFGFPPLETFQGALGPFEDPYFGINAFAAWTQQTDCSAIRMMTIDSGAELDHPDLEENLWKNWIEIEGEPDVDDDGNGFVDDFYGWNVEENDSDVSDDPSGHGTLTAGVLAASGNNGIGGAGICHRGSVIPVRWRYNSSGTRSHSLGGFLQAMEYALANEVRVINQSQSWYCSDRPDEEGCWFSNRTDGNEATNIEPQMELVARAVERVVDAGILFFTSYGNNETNMDEGGIRGYPQDLEGVYGVVNMENEGLNTSSNYGSGAFFAAPGTLTFPFSQVTSFPFVEIQGKPCPSTPRDFINHLFSLEPQSASDPEQGCYWAYVGTSAASPLVAGSAALVWSANPDLSHIEVIEILRSSGRTVPALQGKTIDGKIIDVAAAVAMASSGE
jgi:hypothetical protein